MNASTQQPVGWLRRQGELLLGCLSVTLLAALWIFSMSLHHPLPTSFTVGIDLGESQTFSPRCVRDKLALLYGEANITDDGDRREYWLRHTEVRVKLPFQGVKESDEKAVISFDLVPQSTIDQLILSSEWESEDTLVEGFEQRMSDEITRAMDAIYDGCVTPQTSVWVARCRPGFIHDVVCPKPTPTSARGITPPAR